VRIPLAAALVAGTLVASIAAVPVPAAAEAPPNWQGPLSTRGRYIVDTNGDRFKLKAANWHGASGTWNGSGDVNDPANHHAGEKSDQVPLGLDRAPLRKIVDGIEELGLNSIRLPFSNEMIRDTRPVPDAALAANPALRGRTPLQVYDAVVAELTGRGIAVILNNHTTTSRWCCGVDGNERWNTSQTTAQWESDWLAMVRRYRNNPRVVGADLYNEVRRTVWDDPNWGWFNDHDWFAAAQRLGDRILTEANPDILIIIEGINWTGIPVDGFPHGRPTLEPARTLSHTLVRSGKLVYSAHFYGYTGPNHTGATGMGETSDPRYQDLSRDELFQVLHRQAFFVSAETGTHFTAPLWISEFGVGGRDEHNPKARAWFTAFIDYLIDTDTDFAFWPLTGFHENRRGNGWALLHWNTAGERMGLYDGDDWRASALRRLIASPGRTGQVPVSERWSMLAFDRADAVQSLIARAGGDWDVGARKGACPDDQRLIGLSRTGARALCTDARASRLRATGPAAVVRNEQHVTQDWAAGYTKLECPPGHFLAGYSVRGAAVSAALCAPAARGLGTAGRTVWFDRGDTRPAGAKGGDFAHGHYKGQCDDAQYAAGIAFTLRLGSRGTPDAVLCRAL
jgi:endoglucanase